MRFVRLTSLQTTKVDEKWKSHIFRFVMLLNINVKLKRMLGHDTIYIMKDQNNVKVYNMHTCIGKILEI